MKGHISDTRDYYFGVLWALVTFYKDDMLNREEAFEEMYRILVHMETSWKDLK